MPYDLMLLADPGPDRGRVLELLRNTPDLRADPELDNRFWLAAGTGNVQVNIGTKDPVESVHVEFEIGDPLVADRATAYALALGRALEMRVEDVQFGHEIDETSLPALRRFWQELETATPAPAPPKKARPWWKVW